MTCVAPDVASCLAATPLFSGWSPDERLAVAQGSRVRRLSRGEVFFQPGQPCEGLHLVLEGQVKVFARAADGHEKVLEVSGKGQSVADTQPFGSSCHSYHASALSEAVVLVVPHAALLRAVAANPAAAEGLLADVSRRMARLLRDIEATALHTSVRRVIDYLLRLRSRPEAPLPWAIGADGKATAVVALPVTKATVASLLSVTPEHFSRILHELQERGLIAVHCRNIAILDAQALAQYA